VIPELDEHDAVTLVAQLLPNLSADDESIAAIMAAVARGAIPSEDDILAAFRSVARRWVEGTLPMVGVEPWSAFRARIGRGLERVAQAAAARAPGARRPTVLVFTSAGVIAAAVGAALDLRDEKSVNLSVASLNASLTELDFEDGAWSLRSFNSTPHLHQSRLFTRL
jgi:broad specificity phosphatase PhoE